MYVSNASRLFFMPCFRSAKYIFIVLKDAAEAMLKGKVSGDGCTLPCPLFDSFSQTVRTADVKDTVM